MSSVCSNCGGRGHYARDCPSTKECDCCGSIYHMKEDCPARDKQCDICGKYGHLKIKCRLVTDGIKGKGKGNDSWGKDSWGGGKGYAWFAPYGSRKGSWGKDSYYKGKDSYKGSKDRERSREGDEASWWYPRKGKGKEMKCRNCGEYGHDGAQCMKPKTCYRCGESDHVGALCPAKDKECSVCGKIGHLKVKCDQVCVTAH